MNHFLNVLQSVLAAAFGVQSEKKRKQDFQQASLIHIIIVAIMFLAIFIAFVILVVNIVIP
ncbi:DUF2970 domain-containing protein [Pseudoalteromonas sp. NBT06-2]|uniref:DUF2970 domain-containing protein n=1 Tax=Pseudoalteromonas sp. NBT06-2 TaxID=2025950 RepID=UPI000BA78D3B|nr:DUF2970 domain-containing protein [Pseudoalteromonas sp. NBT06-2]PAJ72625.1 DUF2970 domain-containing protein [Pseudoalteromonas sp. NBT06-2]